jgi:hypothetical protein
MAKLYIWGGVTAAERAHKYLTRYQAQLSVGATADQLVALTELIACLATFLTKWFKPTPVN